ncbi:hypothetical protein BOX15_Mlig025282g4 [Macrostomum lignano]|uniref:Protein kinase domain-containing protein n=1 Tax=Macrostomum lignano TaxID=282301 RepID=A0A267DEY6_9PLAT|nr:hypothetical protein BOX15_Mlig025282g4 [Macrostomum lignano]
MATKLIWLLLLFAVQSALAILDNDENKGNDQLNVTLVTRNFPILFDENFVLQCTPSAEIADQVTKIYFSWRYGALSNSSDVTPVLDFGNGTLVFTRVGVNYGDVWCHAKLLNGTVLKGSVLFVPFYPPVFSPHMETGKVSNTFSYRQELKPGYEAELYCSGQCSCSFELDWLIRIDGAEAEKLQLGTDVQRLLTSLVWHSKPSAYRLEFQQSAGRSKKVTRIVRVGSRVQVLCRLRALTGPTMIELNPVLLYAPHSAVGTFDIILAPPPETLTTTAPVIETCHPLSSFLPKSHGCWPHLGHLAVNGTRAVRERLLNSSAVLPEAAANSADVLGPHMTHCTALAQALLCSSALCSDKPCRQHCLLVRDHVCSSEVKLLRRFPDCELFPDADSEPGCHARFDLEAVMLRHARPASGALESDDSTNTRGCFSRRDFWRGLFYREPSDRAEAVQSGCAKWSSAANRLLSADYFTSLQDAGSECRNPGAQFHRPSCVDKSNTRFFIICPVLECPEDQLPLGLSGLGMSDPIRTAVIVAAVAFVILLCCIILGIMLLRRNVAKSSAKDQCEESVSLAHSHQLLSGDPGDPNMIIQRNVKFGQKTHLAKTYPKLERLAYSHDDFADLGKMIGKGAFFTVHLVETTKYKEARPDMPKLVALKVLDETADDQIVESFFSEAELLLGMEHRYVMQVFGICASTRPFCLLVEYCEFGDLQTLLRNSAKGKFGQPEQHSAVPNGRPTADPAANSEAIELTTSVAGTSAEAATVSSAAAPSESQLRPLRLADLLRMGSQVANALSYISKRGLVFRDLASRNILVTSDYDIRLADFGMCRKLPLGNRAAYVVSESECLPVRWLAPETVRESRFYPESDVYAFGVLLWELFSMGEQPWTGYSVEQVWDMKLQEPPSLLPRPDRAPDNVWALMRACWAQARADRPGFSSLTYQLHQAATHC